MSKGLLMGASLGLLAGAMPAMATQTPIVIRLHDIGGTAKGTAAFEGFQTAAKFWSSHLTTSQPIVIDINTGLAPLAPRVLGSTSSSFTAKYAVNLENRIRARQSTALDAITTLPTLGTGDLGAGTALSMYTPGYTDPDAKTGIDNSYKVYDTDGGYNNSVIGLTTANAKALGYVFAPGTIDASITFSSNFAFDFDPHDGIAENEYDFTAIAIHEIGHALGFVSGVDDYDVLGTGGPYADVVCLEDGTLCKNYPANDDWFGETLDLFRYSAADTLDWTTKTDSYFSIDGGVTAYQSGLFSTGQFNGDGNQASHWIDNLYGPRINPNCSNVLTAPIGVMDPTFGACQQGAVTGLDLAAFDAIGYNSTIDLVRDPGYVLSTRDISSYVPEPAAWTLMVVGFGLVGHVQRRRQVALRA